MSEEAINQAPARTAVRKSRVGTVVSDKMQKTIVVEVERRVPHPVFKKNIRLTSKFYANDEEGKAKTGDKVRIEETRPLSRLKRWRVIAILEKAVTTDAVAISEVDVAAQVPTKTTKPDSAATAAKAETAPAAPTPQA